MSAEVVKLRPRAGFRVCDFAAPAAELVNLVEERILRRRLAAEAALASPPSVHELAHLPDVVRVTVAAMLATRGSLGRAGMTALVEACPGARVLTGGTLGEVETWLKARGYVHVQGSRGFWQRPLLPPGGAA